MGIACALAGCCYVARPSVHTNRQSCLSLCGRIPETPSGPRANVEFRIVLDLDGRFQDISEEFFELTGYKREQLLGKRNDEFTAPVPRMSHSILELSFTSDIFIVSGCLWFARAGPFWFALTGCFFRICRWSCFAVQFRRTGKCPGSPSEIQGKRNLIDRTGEAFYSLRQVRRSSFLAADQRQASRSCFENKATAAEEESMGYRNCPGCLDQFRAAA
jgi:hypothetical protein